MPGARSKLVPLAELAAFVALLELDMWVLWGRHPPWLASLGKLGAGIVLLLSLLRRRRAGRPGGGSEVGRGRAWAEAALSGLALVALTATALAPVREPYEVFALEFQRDLAPDTAAAALEWGGEKLLSAAAQQVGLQLFLWPVLRELLGRPGAAHLLAALLFGLLHLPSPTLVLLTFLAGWAWVGLYRRSSRLVPLIAAHVLLAVYAAGAVPDRLNYRMHVGEQAVEELGRYRALAEPEVRELLRRVTSPSYRHRHGGGEGAYIRALYRDVLGREPGEGEVEFWLRAAEHIGREELALRFATSEEFLARRAGGGPGR